MQSHAAVQFCKAKTQYLLTGKTNKYCLLVLHERVQLSLYVRHMWYMERNLFSLQSQKTVSAYLTSKQILPFGFAEQCCDAFDTCGAVGWVKHGKESVVMP